MLTINDLKYSFERLNNSDSCRLVNKFEIYSSGEGEQIISGWLVTEGESLPEPPSRTYEFLINTTAPEYDNTYSLNVTFSPSSLLLRSLFLLHIPQYANNLDNSGTQ